MRVSRMAMVLALVGVAGCKTQITADLFTSDLIAATQGETLTAPAVIEVVAPTKAKCEEVGPTIAAVFAEKFSAAEFIGCDTVAFETLARFRAPLQIVEISSAETPPIEALAIGVEDTGDGITVSYLKNDAEILEIWNALPEDLTRFQTFSFDPVLAAVLTNDLSGAVSVTTDDVFSDGAPVQGTFSRQMLRRNQIEIRMSNVTNAAFSGADRQALIATFEQQQ